MRVLLTVTGDPRRMADARRSTPPSRPTSRPSSGAAASPTRSGTSPTTRPSGPTARSPAAYAALLKAAYPAIKAADPDATVLVGGLVGNNFEFVERSTTNGAKGSFDGVGVHTDTACLTTDPREYYREPSGRIGRYSFTGYREVRATMLAHGDDKPVWMTELGWPTLSTDLRARRPRRHQGRPASARPSRPTSSRRPTAASPTTRTSRAPPGSTSHDIQTGSTPTTRSTSA